MLRRLVPSLSDWFFAALLGWLFVSGGGWTTLLADGDTGWHIRTGEYILDHGAVPIADLFSFSRPEAPWCAWEWGADVLFALAHRGLGLKGVVLLAGAVICGYLLVLFRHMLWRGANALVALVVCLLAAGASNIHFLARPHVFTLLLLAVSLWLLDRDRARPGPAVWLLVPLTALWANLHAGFLALVASVTAIAAGEAIAGFRAPLRTGAPRHALLAGACALASLLNPYGLGLHRHIFGYLQSSWIREAVDEFQSPRFRSEALLHFEILLFAALMASAWMLGRRRIVEPLLVIPWAHAALISVRHVPVFAVCAAPLVAAAATELWDGWQTAPRSAAAILRDLGRDLSAGFRRPPLWTPIMVAGLLVAGAPLRWPADFPENKFPTALVSRQAGRLAGARVFTSDQWGDYLIYRWYPRQRVFIDGRSDFYGPELGKLYLRMAYVGAGWRENLDAQGVEYVLAPREWPLAGMLGLAHGWRAVDSDRQAVLFERPADQRLKNPLPPAEIVGRRPGENP